MRGGGRVREDLMSVVSGLMEFYSAKVTWDGRSHGLANLIDSITRNG